VPQRYGIRPKSGRPYGLPSVVCVTVHFFGTKECTLKSDMKADTKGYKGRCEKAKQEVIHLLIKFTFEFTFSKALLN
jgi:hypothetical protein